MKTIVTICHNCFSSTTHPLSADCISFHKVSAYIDRHIAQYERMHQMGVETDNLIAEASVQKGKVQALKEFKAHFQGGSFNEY